jgi:DNA recombination protein RmuC
MEIILFFTVATILATITFTKLARKNKELQNLTSEKIISEERVKNLSEKLQEQNKKLQFLEEQNSSLSIYKGRFEQQQEDLQKEKQEWAAQKEALLHKMSEELIRKNNEEQYKFGKNQQENIQKITEELFKNFESVVNKVSSLNDDMKKTSDEVSLTKNALLNPSGAGRTSEITLENILRSSGLREKINGEDSGDFILQSHFTGHDKSGKRPDALVFLPNNHILIIDSKSSSHFLELQKNIEEGNQILEKEISSKIKEAMKKHVEDLRKKDYAKSKLEELGLTDIFHDDRTPIITTVMFLQTEKMLDIIGRLDNDLEQKALDAGIHILSPIGLKNLLNQAKFTIDRAKQEKNILQLKIEIKKVIDSVYTLFERSAEIGEAIGKSFKSYNKFVGTFNNRFLPRINNMSKLGVEVEKKNISNKLKKIEGDGELIEGDLLEIEVEGDS